TTPPTSPPCARSSWAAPRKRARFFRIRSSASRPGATRRTRGGRSRAGEGFSGSPHSWPFELAGVRPCDTTEPRHMKIQPSRVIGCGLIVALAGCQQSYPLASRYIKSVPVQASQGALVTVDPSESQELAGASISIPAGALERDTTVTVELGLDKLATGPDTQVSQVAVWGPAGTKLSAPAEVVLPFALPATESPDGLRVSMLLGNGQKVALDRIAFTVDGTNQAARFRLDELAALEVEVSHCGADHPCADGTVCHEGTCVAPTCGTSTCVSGQLCCDNHCQTVEPGTTTCPVPQCSLDHPCADGS